MTVSEEAWQRLHELRLKGMLEAIDGGAAAELVAVGWSLQRGTREVITPAGRAAHEEWARLPAGSEAETAAKDAYERFLALDLQVKEIVTTWQLEGGSGDTFSPEEWKLIDRLAQVHQKTGFLRRLSELAPRFSTYRPRLTSALEQLEEGNRPYFSGLMVDSYHTVWWQLHEDLLAALGIPRSEDPNQ
jgi:hypothetical protein